MCRPPPLLGPAAPVRAARGRARHRPSRASHGERVVPLPGSSRQKAQQILLHFQPREGDQII